MQADMVLELRVLHLAGRRNSTDGHTEGSLSKRDLKARPHSDTLLPTRSHLLVMLLSLWEPFSFKPPQSIIHACVHVRTHRYFSSLNLLDIHLQGSLSCFIPRATILT